MIFELRSSEMTSINFVNIGINFIYETAFKRYFYSINCTQLDLIS